LIPLCRVTPKADVTATEEESETVTTQVPVPLHAPVHPANALFASPLAVNVTCVLLANPAEQVPGQLIPAGLLVTVPVPTPLSVTATVPSGENVAVTDPGEESVTTQGLVLPVQDPDHDPSPKPVLADAVSVTAVPCGKFAEHVPGQLMPAGLLLTVPEPVTATVSCCNVADWVKLAVIVAAAVTVITHAPVPLQAPPQPVNVKPAAGVSVSVTWVFCANVAVQVEGQLIPAGVLVTVPVPAVGPVIVSWKVFGVGVSVGLEVPPPHPARNNIDKVAAVKRIVRRRSCMTPVTPKNRL